MAVERRDPLPPGRYWVDIPPKDVLAFNVWKNTHRDAVRVQRVSTGSNGWEWHLFEVLAPTPWGGWGFPNIAGADVEGPESVYQVPVVEQPDPEAIFTKALWAVGGIVLAAVALNRVLK